MGRWYRWVLVGVVMSGCGSEAPAGGAMPGGEAPLGAAASTPGGDAKAESPRCPEPRAPLAQRLGVKMAEICEQAAVDPMQVDGTLDLPLAGAWKGEYVSNGLGSSPTRFDANLRVSGGSVSGTTSEPNTFGPYGYAELEADVSGEVYATRQVVLLKTYRTATVTHSVLYVGRLDDAGKRIEGRWRLGGGQGTFFMEKG